MAQLVPLAERTGGTVTSSTTHLKSALMTRLPPEMHEAVILQLPPQHVYKLMQTNKQFYMWCRSETYWARVAMPLAWSTTWWGFPVPGEMVLLHKSYRATLDDFIQSVRDELRTFSDGCEMHADSAVERLVVLGQEIADNEAHHIGEGETMLQLVQRLVEDSDSLESAIKRATQGWDVPRRAGFITASRRANRAKSTFLRSLEDDQDMDLKTKCRVRDYARKLMKDITERRGRSQGILPPRFELHEEDIDASYIFL